MKPIITLLFAIITITSASAQSDIKVLLAKGKVEKWAGKEKHVLVTNTGTTIQKNDTVRLFDNAELVLTAGQKAMTIKVPGKYSTGKLNQLFAKEASNETISKYLTFLAKEMKPEKENYQDFAQAHMKEKGSVNRGPNCAAPLMLMPIPGTVTVPDTLSFRWKRQGGTSFTFAIYPLPEDGPPLFKKDVEDTSLFVMVNDLKLQFGKTYYWQVADITKPSCERMPFTMVTEEQANKLDSDMKQLRSTFNDGTDVALLVWATVCEQNKLYTMAEKAYTKLVTDYPERDDVRQLYASFLGRMGLADDALAVLVKPKKAGDKK